MVKVIGPLGGFDASGSLAGSLVFAKWKGRNYVRRLVKPSNPNTPGQISVRAMWKFLAQRWAGIGTTPQASWEEQAASRSYLPFNAYMSVNQFNWRNFLVPGATSPIARTGTASGIDTFTAAAGVRQITITMNDDDLGDLSWGYMIFKSTTGGFTPAFSNMVQIVRATDVTPVVWVDTPLVPDEYFYDVKPFTSIGLAGSLKGEISATVT